MTGANLRHAWKGTWTPPGRPCDTFPAMTTRRLPKHRPDRCRWLQDEEALPIATLGDLRLHAKALKAWHAGFYGDAPESLERLTALERLPPKLWDERIGPA